MFFDTVVADFSSVDCYGDNMYDVNHFVLSFGDDVAGATLHYSVDYL